jgi:hypothetical protein
MRPNYLDGLDYLLVPGLLVTSEQPFQKFADLYQGRQPRDKLPRAISNRRDRLSRIPRRVQPSLPSRRTGHRTRYICDAVTGGPINENETRGDIKSPHKDEQRHCDGGKRIEPNRITQSNEGPCVHKCTNWDGYEDEERDKDLHAEQVHELYDPADFVKNVTEASFYRVGASAVIRICAV